MKKIECIIRPTKLDEVKKRLQDQGVLGMTVTEVRGCGKQRGHKATYRGAEYYIDLLPKVKLEIVVSDDQAAAAVSAVIETARTGSIGDGKIFVSSVENAHQIRTGDSGDPVL